MNYKEAFIEALTNKELVSEYDRLKGAKLGECLSSMAKRGINYQIDLSTGRIRDEIQKFDRFFYECIWSTIPDESKIKEFREK